MKTVNHIKLKYQLFRLIIPVILLCSLAQMVHAQMPPPGKGGPTNTPLDSWSFNDHTNWTDDESNAPISFSNISFSQLGDGNSLVVNTNVPAWLNYNIYEPGTGATNLVVNAPGSVTFWYAPADWSSTNVGGTGPGQWAELIDVGEWTTNSSYGYWGLSIDPPGENLWFVAQDGAGNTYTLSTPVSWTTNYFHFIAMTYCSTDICIYIDGQLATNDPGGLSVWPGSEVLSNGVFFGSDTNGQMDAQGLFNTVATYNYPLNSNDVQNIFNQDYTYYEISPWNQAMFNIVSAPTSATNGAVPDVITGPGYLQPFGSGPGITSSNVWITNVVATANGSGTNNMVLQFTIQGGSNNVPYDCFANSVLSFGTNGIPWSWMGQGFQGNTYLLSNLPPTACFLILGTPQDSTQDGLTDAYKLLVAKLNPNVYSTDGTGMSDGWEILYFGHVYVDPNADPDGDGLSNYQEF